MDPALSSSPRPKRCYRGRPVATRGPSVDAFACNEVRLLVALFGYQIMHVLRTSLERATKTGWSLRRLLERVLRAPARFTVSGRRVTTIVGRSAQHWALARPAAVPVAGPGRLAPEEPTANCPPVRRSRVAPTPPNDRTGPLREPRHPLKAMTQVVDRGNRKLDFTNHPK